MLDIDPTPGFRSRLMSYMAPTRPSYAGVTKLQWVVDLDKVIIITEFAEVGPREVPE